jgi:adenylate cyclase
VAYFYEWDWVAAERKFKRAIELSPSYVTAHELYGYYFWTMGRTDESIASVKRALELDSLSPLLNTDLGSAYHWARQYDQAIAQFRETIELEPGYSDAYLYLGQAYAQKGLHEAAIGELNKARALSGGYPGVVAELGYVQAVSGQRAEARKLLQELMERGGREYIDPVFVALIYLGLGEQDQALAWLEKAYEARSSWMTWLKVEPRFDRLRSDPRFKDLMRRVNLAP